MTDIVGLDIGGAHLKLARVSGGRVVDVRQLPCPLWQGLDKLVTALRQGLGSEFQNDRIALTMTGELTDLFPDRAAGAILGTVCRLRGTGDIAVYTYDGGFTGLAEARGVPERVASANWHATAQWLASNCDGLLIDIGSTTADIVPMRAGRAAAQGLDDAGRMAHDELVYTGVVRTPVMAVTHHVFFEGRRLGVMAEYFASMSDVYRLTGQLPLHADQLPSADGRGKSVEESRARLARMIGYDAASASATAWAALAAQIAAYQLGALEVACHHVLSALPLTPTATVVGAGVGRFLAEELARRLRRPYKSFAAVVPAEPAVAELAADCAPAVAVAMLFANT